MTAILWLRRDLRVHDHPALCASLDTHEEVIPFFCLDDRLLHGRFASGSRTQFLLESLADLHSSLESLGGGLVVRRGDPVAELKRLTGESGAEEIHVTRELTPYGRERGRRITGAEVVAHPGLTVVEDVTSIETGQGRPYTVFSPFHRRWLEALRRDPLAAPGRVGLPGGLDPGRIPSLSDLGLEQEVPDPMKGGEREALRRLEAFLEADAGGYAANHDALAADRTSRLSPYLHFGCVSARLIESRLGSGEGPDAFRRQLCWRDFHHQVLFHHPANRDQEFQERYRTLDWDGSDEDFAAWAEGRTGFPLVDAGMRQLRAEGWMHNRARLVAGSFLTKDLGIDWRRGEAWFMRFLLDGDEANNNGNWQWIASVGTDPAPYFQRMFNPTLQMERFDPDGKYARRHLPELRGVPDKWLREPWEMPAEVQSQAGCVIGRDYPGPIVDRRASREAAKQRYRAAAG